MKIEQYIPNTLTFANLLCGFLGIINVIYGDLETAAILVFVAAIFDLLDGLAARALRVQSKTGKQLDSFSDMVSFGILPAALLMILLLKTHTNWVQFAYILNVPVVGLLGFAFPAGAAYRLARFNLDTEESSVFKGVPCPAAGLVVASLPLILENDLLVIGYETVYLTNVVLNPWLLLGLMVVIPLLMVSNLSMLSLKLSGLHWKGQQLPVIFVLFSVILFIFLYFAAIPIIFLLYIIISLLFQKRLT